MSMTAWVDVAIGLTLVYLGMSLFVTVINEFIAQVFSLRGKALRDSLQSLINQGEIANRLAESPVLSPFFGAKTTRLPAYVDSKILGRLLVGGLALGATSEQAYQRAVESINALADSPMKHQLQALVASAEETAAGLASAVSDWAERSMVALGDQYRRSMRVMSLLIGLVAAIALNIDTVELTTTLYRDKELRESAANVGARIAGQVSQETFEKCRAMDSQQRAEQASCKPLLELIDTVRGHEQSLGKLPIGWTNRATPTTFLPASCDAQSWKAWFIRLGGWLLTALALSLGAPFWFDLLNKLVDVRHGMAKPEKDK